MTTSYACHPYTYLSPVEAADPLETIIDVAEESDLYEDRKCLLDAFSTYISEQDESTEGLSKSDQSDLSRRLCKMLEAAHALSILSTLQRVTKLNKDVRRLQAVESSGTTAYDWRNQPAFLYSGDLEDPVDALLAIVSGKTLFDRRKTADAILQQYVQTEKWTVEDSEDNKDDLQFFNHTRSLWELAYRISEMLNLGCLSFQYHEGPARRSRDAKGEGRPALT